MRAWYNDGRHLEIDAAKVGHAKATHGAMYMIIVEVKVFATLRRHFPELEIGEAMAVELPEDATVGQLLKELELPAEEVKVIFVNGTVRKEDHRLSDGDEVGFFPPVGGG